VSFLYEQPAENCEYILSFDATVFPPLPSMCGRSVVEDTQYCEEHLYCQWEFNSSSTEPPEYCDAERAFGEEYCEKHVLAAEKLIEAERGMDDLMDEE